MQAIQSLTALLPSYMIYFRPKTSVGLCATACGTHVTLSAFQTLSNAETWTQTGKGLACAAVGLITTAAGLAMTAASLGLLDSELPPCIWMNEEPACKSGVVTLEYHGTNTVQIFRDKAEACAHLDNHVVKDNLFTLNCHSDTSSASPSFAIIDAPIEKEHPLSNNALTAPNPRFFPFTGQQVQSTNLSNSTTNKYK